MSFSIEERREIFENAKQVYDNDELFEIKIQELFKYKNLNHKSIDERLKSTNKCFEKIDNVLYTLDVEIKTNVLNNEDATKVLKICIDTLIIYEYFKYHLEAKTIKDEAHYNYKQIRQKFEEIKPFLDDKNIKLNIPILPNTTYNDAYYELKKIGINKEISITLLGHIFSKEKKAKVPKQYKREIKEVTDTLQHIIDVEKSKKKHEDKIIKYHQDRLDKLKNPFD